MNLKCYTTEHKQLTYFREYSQDSCLFECKMKKIARICECEPWYMVAAAANRTFSNISKGKINISFN